MKLIDALHLEKCLKKYQQDCEEANDIMEARVLADVIIGLQDCATINSEDLRAHGKWIGIGYEGYADGNPVYDYWECSECGNEEDGEDVPEQNPYCRSCGSKMDGDEVDMEG